MNKFTFAGLATHEVLAAAAPPITLIEWLERHEQRHSLPEDVHKFLVLWRAIRAGDELTTSMVSTECER